MRIRRYRPAVRVLLPPAGEGARRADEGSRRPVAPPYSATRQACMSRIFGSRRCQLGIAKNL
ncbi:hypothetical protein EX530_08555 [Xanthomonas phaseoli]